MTLWFIESCYLPQSKQQDGVGGALFSFVFGRLVHICTCKGAYFTHSLMWSHFILDPVILAAPPTPTLSLLPPESPPHHANLLPLPLASALCTPSLLFCLSPSPRLPPRSVFFASLLLLVALIFHSCCSKTSQDALLEPVMFFPCPPPLFATFITAIRTSSPLMLRLPAPTSCSECAPN